MYGFVYILQDQHTGRFYVGSTDDLERRLRQHKSGNTPTTRRMGTISLVFSQRFDTLEVARKAERKLKRMKRRDYLEKIVRNGIIKKLD